VAQRPNTAENRRAANKRRSIDIIIRTVRLAATVVFVGHHGPRIGRRQARNRLRGQDPRQAGQVGGRH